MAGRKPKSEIMTTAEMIEAGKRKRAVSKIYKAESQEITDEAISKSVLNAISDLKRLEGRQRISLDDCEMVRAVAEAYLESCAVSSTFPSMSSLAMALGYSRQNLYHFMKEKGDTETGLFLTQLHDLFGNILAENSLRNNANNITAIFILKSLFGYKETQSIELLQGMSMDNEPTADDLFVRAELLSDE